MSEPGQIIQWTDKNFLPRFAYIHEQGLIDNGLSWYEWHKISYNEHLLVLGKMKLSKETTTAAPRPTGMATLAMATVTTTTATGWSTAGASDYKQAQNEWNKQQYIDGYVCLTSNNSRIWISHLDIKYFEKVGN